MYVCEYKKITFNILDQHKDHISISVNSLYNLSWQVPCSFSININSFGISFQFHWTGILNTEWNTGDIDILSASLAIIFSSCFLCQSLYSTDSFQMQTAR